MALKAMALPATALFLLAVPANARRLADVDGLGVPRHHGSLAASASHAKLQLHQRAVEGGGAPAAGGAAAAASSGTAGGVERKPAPALAAENASVDSSVSSVHHGASWASALLELVGRPIHKPLTAMDSPGMKMILLGMVAALLGLVLCAVFSGGSRHAPEAPASDSGEEEVSSSEGEDHHAYGGQATRKSVKAHRAADGAGKDGAPRKSAMRASKMKPPPENGEDRKASKVVRMASSTD